jgi:hypothetical protein
MKLFNQTKNQLRWSMGGITYSAPPFEVVEPEVPDVLGYAVASMGLPVGPEPVARDTSAPAHVAHAEPKAEKPKPKRGE